MLEVSKLNLPSTDLIAINQCRLYLQAYHVSDLSTASGNSLSLHAWEGVPRDYGLTNKFTWPKQGMPSQAAWKIWRSTLRQTILSRGMRLRESVGLWLRKDYDIWQWYYCPNLDSLIQITPIGDKLIYRRQVPYVTHNIFSNQGTLITETPNNLLKASVRKTCKDLWWLIDTGSFTQPLPSVPHTLPSSFTDIAHKNTWCTTFLEIPSLYSPLLPDIQSGSVLVVSDGSYNPTTKLGTAAWILEGRLSNIQISGSVITPGSASEQSAYRSELAGILVAITVINALASFHNLKTSLTLHCDCESGLKKVFREFRPIHMHDSNHDILKAIHYELCHSNIKWTGSYIKGHQDDQIPFHKLDRPSQLNVIMDQKAKNFLASITESHRHYDVYSNSWRLRIGNHPIIHDFDRTIYDITHTPVVKQYWMNKSRIQDQHFTSVNWQRLGTALDRMPFS
jgi:hypothetical protein